MEREVKNIFKNAQTVRVCSKSNYTYIVYYARVYFLSS